MGNTIQQDLANQTILRLLLRYSGPAVIESVAVSLYNIVDSIFIGHDVGPMALSALAVALPLMNLVVGFCTLITAGGAAIISIYLGKRDKVMAESAVNNVIVFCLIHAVVFGGLMLLYLDPILQLFGATDATIGFARRYMRIILIASPISYLFLGLNNMMRATGYPKKAMISALLSVAVNVALCPLFINVLHWSIEGAAVATVLGQTAALIWCICHFLDPKALIRFNAKARWITTAIIKKIYAIGMAPFLMSCCACIVVVFLNHALLVQGGTEGNYYIGAYGILNRVTMIFIMTVQGLTLGMQPILGFNYGANIWPRVKQTLHIGIIIGVAITTVGWIITECFPSQLSDIFTFNSEIIWIDKLGFRIYFMFYPLVGAQMVIQNFFQYIDQPKWSIALSMTRQLVFLLPFLIFLPRIMGPEGVWASMAASDLLSFIVAWTLIVVVMRRLDKKEAALSKARPPYK